MERLFKGGGGGRVMWSWYEYEDEFDDTNNSESALRRRNTMNDAIQVRLGKLGERTQEYTLAGNATVKDLITASGQETAGYTIRVNNEAADLNTPLGDDDIVQLLAAVKLG